MQKDKENKGFWQKHKFKIIAGTIGAVAIGSGIAAVVLTGGIAAIAFLAVAAVGSAAIMYAGVDQDYKRKIGIRSIKSNMVLAVREPGIV